MAESTSLLIEGVPEDNVTFTWPKWNGTALETHTARYFLSGDKLVRVYEVVDIDGTSSETTTVALYITNLEFSLNGRLLTFTVASTPEEVPQRTWENTYKVGLRPQL